MNLKSRCEEHTVERPQMLTGAVDETVRLCWSGVVLSLSNRPQISVLNCLTGLSRGSCGQSGIWLCWG